MGKPKKPMSRHENHPHLNFSKCDAKLVLAETNPGRNCPHFRHLFPILGVMMIAVHEGDGLPFAALISCLFRRPR